MRFDIHPQGGGSTTSKNGMFLCSLPYTGSPFPTFCPRTDEVFWIFPPLLDSSIVLMRPDAWLALQRDAWLRVPSLCHRNYFVKLTSENTSPTVQLQERDVLPGRNLEEGRGLSPTSSGWRSCALLCVNATGTVDGPFRLVQLWPSFMIFFPRIDSESGWCAQADRHYSSLFRILDFYAKIRLPSSNPGFKDPYWHGIKCFLTFETFFRTGRLHLMKHLPLVWDYRWLKFFSNITEFWRRACCALQRVCSIAMHLI